MLDEGVESRSDGVHRVHWTRIDSVRLAILNLGLKERVMFLVQCACFDSWHD